MHSPLLVFLAVTFSEVLPLILGIVFGGMGVAVFNKLVGKKKESLEVSNLTQEGANLVVQIRTNIDKLVDEKTVKLNQQISELQGTILEISIKYKRDLDGYVDKMAEIETRMDKQSERTEKSENRNEELEKNLEAEVAMRRACIQQLADLQKRVYELEKISAPISNQEKNNPDNPNNTL